jgi:hypothetical protein
MSYSVKTPCGNCTKIGQCVDGTIISYAVYALHGLGEGKGHLGAGLISIDCCNFEGPKEQENKKAT